MQQGRWSNTHSVSMQPHQEGDEAALDKQEMVVRSRRLRRRMFKSSLLVMVEALFGTLDTHDKGYVCLDPHSSGDSRAAEQGAQDHSSTALSASSASVGTPGLSIRSSKDTHRPLNDPSDRSAEGGVLDDLLSVLLAKSPTAQGGDSSNGSDLHAATYAAHSVQSALEADFANVLDGLR